MLTCGVYKKDLSEEPLLFGEGAHTPNLTSWEICSLAVCSKKNEKKKSFGQVHV